jgi:hypothetical protein
MQFESSFTFISSQQLASLLRDSKSHMQNSLIDWIYIIITFETSNRERFTIIGRHVTQVKEQYCCDIMILTTVSWKMNLCFNNE